MYHSFFQTICRVGVFLICAQAVLHFRPREVYERYMKLLIGAMVLVQLVLPFGSFLLGGRKEEALRALEQFKQDMEQGVRQAEENAAAADALLEQMTLEEVRKAVEAQRGREGDGAWQEGSWEGQSDMGSLEESGESGGKNPEEAREGGEMERERIAVEIEVETVEPVRMGGE